MRTLLEVRSDTEDHFLFDSDIGIPNNIQKLSGNVNIWSSGLHVALELSKGCEAPFPDEVET